MKLKGLDEDNINLKYLDNLESTCCVSFASLLAARFITVQGQHPSLLAPGFSTQHVFSSKETSSTKT